MIGWIIQLALNTVLFTYRGVGGSLHMSLCMNVLSRSIKNYSWPEVNIIQLESASSRKQTRSVFSNI
jgi:hypothetical protein